MVLSCFQQRFWVHICHLHSVPCNTFQAEIILTLFSFPLIAHALRTGMHRRASLIDRPQSFRQLFWETCLHIGGLRRAFYLHLKSLWLQTRLTNKVFLCCLKTLVNRVRNMILVCFQLQDTHVTWLDLASNLFLYITSEIFMPSENVIYH